MKHYWNVYKKFVSTSVAVESSFRTSFILLILMDAIFFMTSLMSINILFDHVPVIGIWNREQFSFFICFMLMIDNLHMMIISQSFWELSFNIRTGQLDYVILRPLNTMFSVFFRHFRTSSLFNTPLFMGFLIYYGLKCDFSFLDWFLLPIFIMMSLTLFVSIEFIMSALMFWTTDGNGINFLRMQLQQVARWPQHIYAGLMRKVFITIIPVLMVGSAPVQFLFDKSKWEFFSLFTLFILIFATTANKVWAYALTKYDSASS